MIYSSVIFRQNGCCARWSYCEIFIVIRQILNKQRQSNGFFLSFTLLSAIGSFVVAWIIKSYNLDNKKVDDIHAQLTSGSS